LIRLTIFFRKFVPGEIGSIRKYISYEK